MDNDAMEAAGQSCGLLDLLLEMFLDESDPLIQIASLDLMEKLSTKQCDWLYRNDLLIQQLLVTTKGTPQPDPILFGPSLRILGKIPDTSLFKDALLNLDVTLLAPENQLVFIDVVSSFCAMKNENLELILDTEKIQHGWLSFENLAFSELQSAVLHSVAMVIHSTSFINDANASKLLKKF